MSMLKGRRQSGAAQSMSSAFGAGRIKASHNAIQSTDIQSLLQEFHNESLTFNTGVKQRINNRGSHGGPLNLPLAARTLPTQVDANRQSQASLGSTSSKIKLSIKRTRLGSRGESAEKKPPAPPGAP